MNKRRMSILLMVLTIGTIAAFQVYWLRKNYLDEQKTFTLRTNLLFKETLFKLQTSKINLDSINIKSTTANGTITVRAFHVRDSGAQKQEHLSKSVVVALRGRNPNVSQDSLMMGAMRQINNPNVVLLLSKLDSLENPVTLHEATAKFGKVLAAEGIKVPFTITAVADSGRSKALPGFTTTFTRDDVRAGKQGERKNVRFLTDSLENRITLGFAHPTIFELTMGNNFWLIAWRLAPQLLFSLVLVSVTTLSFLLLYRNWQRQHKLTLLKNDFISNITHELKTPIATVSVAVEALRNFNALQDPARTREYLDISASELQRLSLLVDKVLKLSLFERQEIELKKDPFDLCILIDEVLASMRLQFEKYQARVEFAPERVADGAGLHADYRLRADKLHFTSVIFNLLDNALKYSRINPFIRVELGAEPEHLVLSVADNGPGIPAAYRDRIFEKFFRVPTGNLHEVKGYGLGLSYVSYVVQRQGGVISVDSQEGIGSRFVVKIPRDHV